MVRSVSVLELLSNTLAEIGAGTYRRLCSLSSLSSFEASEIFRGTTMSSPASGQLDHRKLLLPVLFAVAVVHGDESMSRNDLVAALQRGGCVILMRHASAPGAAPDAAHANADNTRLERQLDEQGQASAHAMGDAFRQLKIPVGKILSSPAYRALETVKFSKLGQPTTFPELGPSEQAMFSGKSGTRATWLKGRIAEPPTAGTNTLIVTHSPNIAEAFPQDADGLAEGEALIFRPERGHGIALIARVKIDEWASLAAHR
jgi:phosphohistidine phosphatase SixA